MLKVLLLLAASTLCEPGDYLVDFSNNAPGAANSAGLSVQVMPFSASILVYPPGRFSEAKRSCGGLALAPTVMPMVDRKVCVRPGPGVVDWKLLFKGEAAI